MQRSLTATLSLITLGLLTACGNDSMPIEEKPPMLIEGIRATASGAQIAADCDVALENAKAEFAFLEAQTGPATVESVFGQYEKVGDALTLIGDVWHRDRFTPMQRFAMRPTPVVKTIRLFSQVGLSRPYYDRIAAIDTSNLDTVERFMVEEAVAGFQRSGVDRDEATRQKIRERKTKSRRLVTSSTRTSERTCARFRLTPRARRPATGLHRCPSCRRERDGDDYHRLS